jgi:hypothetical protein
MNLYRLILITPTGNINRGVWAKEVTVKDGVYYFKDDSIEKDNLVATFPTQFTSVTNIETKEEYEAKKEKNDTYLTSTFEKIYKK